jgi:signal transduction histidine kinase
MSAGSASPPTEVGQTAPAGEPGSAREAPWPDPEGRERVLERLIGVRSSKPSFYAAWREKSARLDRTIETLERISAALCVTPEGPGALCEAVVEAAGHHFSAPWAAMTFADGLLAHELPPVIMHSTGKVARGWDDAPPVLHALAARALRARGPVVAAADPGGEAGADGDPRGEAVAVPMLSRDELAGALAVGLPADAQIEESDLSILLTLANHAGLALHNAWTFQESERLRERAEAASRAAELHAAELGRRSRQLERARKRLEEARRRQLLGQERSRIARELHDSVAQHLLSIGMMLEWCRKQEPPSSPIVERLVSSKELARSALEEIRAVIFELSSAEQPEDLPAALEELVEELRHTTDLEIALRTRGARRTLPRATEHALSQIAREALFNVTRHADASRGWVAVRYVDRSVRLTVADDGHGDPERLQRRLESAARGGSDYHRGLANISERARELAGRVRFAPRRGGGVRLEVTAPLEPTFPEAPAGAGAR